MKRINDKAKEKMMANKSGLGLCLAALAMSSVSLLIGQEVKPKQSDVLAGQRGPFVRGLAAPKVTDGFGQKGGQRGGTFHIIYDDGVASATPTISSLSYGNRFNTATGSPVTSFSVTMLTFYMVAGVGTDNVFVSVFGSLQGTTAPVLGSQNIGPVVSGAFNTFTVGPYAGAGSFLAGVWYVAGDSVGLGSGTVNGQGHHGMVINDIVGTGFQTLPGLNTLIRARSTFIPVELMDFKVTDE